MPETIVGRCHLNIPDRVFNSTGDVCGGNIVEKITREFDASMGPMRIGGDNPYKETRKFYCMNCGVRYEFIPDWAKR